ncbi:MAG: tetratricopeptide repeat protein [Saprospiraceae bacterium]|nr:tetratricopeptide repeat protein [Saprospiraceae bacterium]
MNLANGDNQKAIENLNSAIKLDPKNYYLPYTLGAVLDGLGKPKEAETAYKNALIIKPDYFDANYNLGALYFNQGVELNNVALQLSDDKAFAAKMKEADILFKKSITSLEKAEHAKPKDVDTLNSLLILYQRVEDNINYQRVSKKLGK